MPIGSSAAATAPSPHRLGLLNLSLPAVGGCCCHCESAFSASTSLAVGISEGDYVSLGWCFGRKLVFGSAQAQMQ